MASMEEEVHCLTLPDLSDITTLRRRPRSVKNSLVNLDEVDCAPGPAFINWVVITKTKLLEREKELLIRRIDTIKRALLDAVQQFNQRHHGCANIRPVANLDPLLCQINMGGFIKPCIDDLEQELNAWEGTKSKKTSEFTQFRKYFRKCKNWFDQKKLPSLAIMFWVPILRLIQRFSHRHSLHYAPPYRDQFRMHFNHLLFLMLVQSTFKVPNTKERIVIGVGLYARRFSIVSALEIEGVEELIHQTEPILSCTDIRKLVVEKLQCGISESAPLLARFPQLDAPLGRSWQISSQPSLDSVAEMRLSTPPPAVSFDAAAASSISAALWALPPVLDGAIPCSKQPDLSKGPLHSSTHHPLPRLVTATTTPSFVRPSFAPQHVQLPATVRVPELCPPQFGGLCIPSIPMMLSNAPPPFRQVGGYEPTRGALQLAQSQCTCCCHHSGRAVGTLRPPSPLPCRHTNSNSHHHHGHHHHAQQPFVSNEGYQVMKHNVQSAHSGFAALGNGVPGHRYHPYLDHRNCKSERVHEGSGPITNAFK